MSKSRQLGLFTTLSLVVGTMVGGGILVLPSVLAQYGKFGFWAWPIASVAVFNLAKIFGKLSKENPQDSGPAGYVKHYFGNFMGFQVAWAHALAISLGVAVITISFASYFVAIFNLNASYELMIALIGLWTVFILQALCTLLSLNALVIITVFKVIALGLVMVVGFTSMRPEIVYAQPVKASLGGFSGMFGALALSLFAFVGIEGATLPGENVKNASRVIPLSTMLGTIIAAVLSIGVYVVVWSVMPLDELIKSNAPVAMASEILMGSFGAKLIAGFAVIGCIGSINGCLFVAAHILRNSALEGWLPRAFAYMTPACFPITGGLLTGLIASLVVVMYNMVCSESAYIIRNNAAQLEVFLIAIVYLMSCMAYRVCNGNKLVWWIGVIFCAAFLYGAMDDYYSAVIGIMTFFSGSILYTAFYGRMNKQTKEKLQDSCEIKN